MIKDVLALASGKKPAKGPSKETLNHPGIIALASGLDPFQNTKEAFLRAYHKLGIDIINRVPLENAPKPLKPGESTDDGNGYGRAHLGMYDTYMRFHYPYADVDDFLEAESVELDYQKLITPVPHRMDATEIAERMAAVGDIGLYYYMFYTTFFMWGVECLGWEVFMLAASIDPVGFQTKFLDKAFEQSKLAMELLSSVDSPFVFVHDDLANANGPVFSPAWYDEYIFPRYQELFAIPKKQGKKIILTADGNMETFFPRLKEVGVDGVMLENPATDFDKIIAHFGDKIIIGGIETNILTFGTPEEVARHTKEVHRKTKDIPGFAMSTPGGIHGNIPMENLVAYFNARVETGHTPEDWQKN